MAITFKTQEMIRDEQFSKIEMLISEFVDAKFAGNRILSEMVLNSLFRDKKQENPFGIITRDGVYLTFRSKREMQEYMGFE